MGGLAGATLHSDIVLMYQGVTAAKHCLALRYLRALLEIRQAHR